MSEEDKVIRLEFDWLLKEEVPSILSQLKNIIDISIKKFSSAASDKLINTKEGIITEDKRRQSANTSLQTLGFRGIPVPGASLISKSIKGNKFLLALPNSDAVKGLINISGDSVTTAELRFKFPKFANTGISTFIFEQCPWRLQQLQDARNHLELGIDELSEYGSYKNLTTGHQVLQLMDKAMVFLSRAKGCLIIPEKHTLSELMGINAQKVLNPPVPEEMIVSFHVNCDKLIFCVYCLTILTAAPHQKGHHHDHHHHHDHNHTSHEQTSIGYTFDHENRWFELANKAEIICAVPWLKDMILWINTAHQLCQQLKDKISVFHNLLPDLVMKESMEPLGVC